MAKLNWIARDVKFLYKDAIATAVVETKIKNGWDIIFCLSSGVNISLLSQLPPGWIFAPFCGGNYFYSIPFEEKFRIFPEKKIITYDDLSRENGVDFLLKLIAIVNDKKNILSNKNSIGECAYKSVL